MATVLDKSRVLIVDHEPQIGRALGTVLSMEGYVVRTVDEGQRALAHLNEWRPKLVITDLMMERMDGIELCRRIRAASNVPIIVLSGEVTEHSKVEALDSGADDCISKPFGTAELLARIRAALRRGAGAFGDDAESLEAGDCRVDLDGRRVYVGARETRLTPKEFDLFVYFARHPNRVLRHETLLAAVWGENSQEHREYLRVFIRQLRQKLEANPSKPQYLLNEPWVGYRFNPRGTPVEDVDTHIRRSS
jgi:two-component system, OmpR family, KDP operon response regulator KdpE